MAARYRDPQTRQACIINSSNSLAKEIFNESVLPLTKL
jgi:hypothetical protein